MTSPVTKIAPQALGSFLVAWACQIGAGTGILACCRKVVVGGIPPGLCQDYKYQCRALN